MADEARLSSEEKALSRRTLLVAAAAGGAAALVSHMGSAAVLAAGPNDPALTVARYSLAVDGVEIAAFSELVEITQEIDTSDFSADRQAVLRKLPGKRKPPTLTLKRGRNNSTEIQSWFEAVLNGSANALRSATLVMYGIDGRPVDKYQLQNAFPSRLEIGALKAGASEVLIETVTITCEHIQRVSP